MSISPSVPATTDCLLCAGTGWTEPWVVGDDTPELVTCDRCLGVGLADCPDCSGDGSVALPVLCRCPEGAG